jgi:hypothetical protein
MAKKRRMIIRARNPVAPVLRQPQFRKQSVRDRSKYARFDYKKGSVRNGADPNLFVGVQGGPAAFVEAVILSPAHAGF